MHINKKLFVLISVNLFLVMHLCVVAQVSPPTEAERRVHTTLDNFVQSPSFSSFHTRRYPTEKGIINMVLVVKGKKVESIFVDSTSNLAPTFVNAFSNYIKDMEFDFKLPKGERQKVKHQFNIQ